MTIRLSSVGTFSTGIFDEGAAEIVAHDPATQRLFVINSDANQIDVLDITDPSAPTLVTSIDLLAALGDDADGVNSIAVKNGIVAAAVENANGSDQGFVAFLDTDGTVLNTVSVGVLPDAVTFTPDGLKVLVANEAEPTDDGDPLSSVSIIDISNGVENASVNTLDFTGFDDRQAELEADGLRLFPGQTLSADLEPEYVAVSPDGTQAFVTLQEANSFAVIDLESETIEGLVPLGLKDFSRGLPQIENFDVDSLPVLGTTEGGQDILLGGLSGLWFQGTTDDGALRFLTLPDRGPNGAPTDVDGDGANERPFALPDFQAQIVPLELDPETGTLTIVEDEIIFLTREDGTTPITGLPNIEGVDEEPVDLSGNLLPYDPLGGDMEGIVQAGDGTFWTVDEYRPSIYHFDANGQLIDRFVPEGTAALAGGEPGDFGTETLPEELSSRRPNRGFEAVALDEENGVVYAFIQTPLSNPDRATSDASDVIRIVGIDTASGAAVEEYVYLLERPDVRSGGAVDKIGDAVYLGDGRFSVIERDSAVGPEASKFLFNIDITHATNLLADGAPSVPEGDTLEGQSVADLLALGITPVEKTKVANLPSLGYTAGDKPEGLALLDDGRLAVLNDNDFGLLDQDIPVDGTVPLNPDPVPVTLGLIDFAQSNGLDGSDDDGTINIASWPVFGMFMPDAVASFETDGRTFYITANEGDDRGEDESIADITLDPTAFPDAASLQTDEAIGPLGISLIDGDLDGDGDFDQLLSYGARSFTIWDANGNLVFDSGDQLEQITAEDFPLDFNSTNDENDSFDNRSDNKGPEPEGVTVGQVGDSIYAFIGLERIGGIMVYDVTEPANAEFVQYLNNRDFRVEDVEASVAGDGAVGDLGPEGLAFISAEDSPTGVPLLAVGNEVSGTTTIYDIREPDYTLQILHASDLEGGVEAIDNAPNFAAVVDFLEDEVENSITISSGDNVIPGPFFNAAGLIDDQVYNDFYNALFGLPSDSVDQTYQSLEGAGGRVDISIMNAIGFDAAALGNHEFDSGTAALADFIAAEFEGEGLADDAWAGTQFPYLAANLDTSADSTLDALFTDEILPNTAFQSGPEASLAGDDVPKIAPATIIEEGGEQIGVVGAVTPFLDTISSPGNTTVFGPGAGTTDMQALATILQPVIDELTGQGIDKIIVASHLQNIELEQELAGLLSGVDIMVAGGSETLLADREDEGRGLQPGDEAEGPYPIVTENADGEPVVIVNTADEYSYVGRLVVDFDADGVVIPGSVDPSVSGAFRTTDADVEALWGSLDDAFAEGTKGALVRSLTDEVSTVVEAQDGNIFGQTAVYLEGRRDIVRSQETNLGNITADANLAAAQLADETVAVSLKNGGGIRASIGSIGDNGELLPPVANPAAGKEEGEISQLDIDNTLRFNNGLSLVTVTAEQLKEVIEHGLEGSFQHVGGIRLSYEPDNAEGSRVQTLAVVDDNGEVVDIVVQDGEVVGDAGRPIRVVTLDFLAEGGSGFPYPDFIAADPEFANVVELDGEDENGNGVLDDGEDTNLNGELDGPALTDPGVATFTRTGGEQDAFAEYLAASFADTPFTQADTPESGDTRIQNLSERADTVLDGPGGETFQLQILHASDLEGGVDAIDRAPNFAAIVDLLEDEVANSLTLSAGDNVIPGPFFNAALFVDDQIFNDAHNAVFGLPDAGGVQYEALEGDRGRIDMSIMNVIGFDASALGNHEFDTGTGTLAGFIEPDFGDTDALSDDEWIGTTFPYLSANLDFSTDGALAGLATTDIIDAAGFITGPAESEAGETTPRLAPAAIFEEGGERIGVVGATTPLLDVISSPGGVGVSPDSNDMQALAAILQPVFDQMVADGVNKIVLVTHLQQIALEEELITLLEDVDIVIAGGSDTLLADETDVLRAGDVADRGYPILTTNASGDPAAIVSTDGEYSYVGRLVVEFDGNGVLIPDSIDAAESGAFATTDAVVSDLYGDADPFAEGSKAALTQGLVAAVDGVVSEQDGNTFGNTDVYLDGRRDSVRTEETNLGNLTADANLALAQDVDDAVLVSLKNGGGIRAPIGETDMDGTLLPPQANPDVGKEEGEVSQLDIVNALRFNNGLTLLTLTAEELAAIIEHGVAASDPGSTPGRFPQVGGIRFSFDPDQPGLDGAEPGQLSRVQSLEIVDSDGIVLDTVVEDGTIVGDPARDIRVVTLDFLAGGGDGYRFDEFGENRVDLEDLGLADGAATFAAAGSEQDALAEYLAANFPTPAEAFAQAETDPAADTRIQNLNAQDDADEAVLRYFNEDELFHLFTVDPDEQAAAEADDAFVFEGEAFTDFSGDPGATPVFRFVNVETGGLFYTISDEEAEFVEANIPVWESQGEVFQAFEVAATDEVSAIYRFFNAGEGAHFYTASPEERDFVINTLPQYEFEGIAFFA